MDPVAWLAWFVPTSFQRSLRLKHSGSFLEFLPILDHLRTNYAASNLPYLRFLDMHFLHRQRHQPRGRCAYTLQAYGKPWIWKRLYRPRRRSWEFHCTDFFHVVAHTGHFQHLTVREQAPPKP